ncbi:hypothetical protein HB779_07950 [Phyllobacterium sp. 628]|uniref:hypothetical protein n=1 Tax=Phyllobacterium sp. 628 TaxID=2718938 RepID=UPI0016622020|nr:hypothetical protein [Phyllobacterium sp. 628]QND51841.1 hypothetical protein HB779_07950 [Phyllobacterium sp. 628]
MATGHTSCSEGEIVELEAIEQAIRNAFAKADVSNPAVRQKIYESAWTAHERSLTANGALDEVEREERRERLKSAITRIEAESRDPSRLAPEPVAERREPSLSVESAQRVEPAQRREPASGRVEPSLSGAAAPELESPDRSRADNYRPAHMQPRQKKTRERKKASGLTKFVIIFVILLVALGLLWLVASGLIHSKPAGNSTPPASSSGPAVGSHEPMKGGQLSAEGNWITIFDPSDMTRVSVAGRATATVTGDNLQKSLKIKSPGETDDITFQVGQGVLQQLVGKHAIFDIIAKAEDGTGTQMAVSCDFGGLAECGRKRYDVTDASNEYLFELQFPDGKKASTGGLIKINSDIARTGKAIDIFSIRVLVSN